MARQRRGKSPRQEKRPTGSKKPVNRADPDLKAYHASTISWRFHHMDSGDRWGLESIHDATLRRIVLEFRKYDSRTWGEILRDTRGKGRESRGNSSHPIPVASLSRDARHRLQEELKMVEVSHLFSLYLSPKERIYGVRQGSVLDILWYDPKYEVCPSRR